MNLKAKLVEIIQNSVGGCARHWAEVIADHLIDNGVTVQEWISVKDRLPSEEEWLSAEGCSFLCKVLIPIPGGAADNKQQVIEYYRLHGRWACEDMIVTHWMPLPKGEDTP